MKRLFFIVLSILSIVMFVSSCNNNDEFKQDGQNVNEINYDANRKMLVAYFSATGNTENLAKQIVAATGADMFRIQAKEPYSVNPYDDSDRIQNESYKNLRPAVADLPDNVEDYDVIFIGSPIWWHNPAMVVCTFLESYNLKDKIVVPFFTYGSTTWLQQSVGKIYDVTPQSIHLNTYTGRDGVENWLRQIHLVK